MPVKEIIMLYFSIGFVITGFSATADVIRNEVNPSLGANVACAVFVMCVWPIFLVFLLFDYDRKT